MLLFVIYAFYASFAIAIISHSKTQHHLQGNQEPWAVHLFGNGKFSGCGNYVALEKAIKSFDYRWCKFTQNFKEGRKRHRLQVSCQPTTKTSLIQCDLWMEMEMKCRRICP
jgi:hypothetical protein